jgi:hypothetical protein
MLYYQTSIIQEKSRAKKMIADNSHFCMTRNYITCDLKNVSFAQSYVDR